MSNKRGDEEVEVEEYRNTYVGARKETNEDASVYEQKRTPNTCMLGIVFYTGMTIISFYFLV